MGWHHTRVHIELAGQGWGEHNDQKTQEHTLVAWEKTTQELHQTLFKINYVQQKYQDKNHRQK